MAIKQHEKWNIPNLENNSLPLEIEANWRAKQQEELQAVDDNAWQEEAVRIKLGEHRATIKIKDLWLIAFLLASPDEQAKMAPVKYEKVRFLKQTLKIKCDKDMKRGEELYVKHTVRIPDHYFSEFKTPTGVVVPQINRSLIS